MVKDRGTRTDLKTTSCYRLLNDLHLDKANKMEKLLVDARDCQGVIWSSLIGESSFRASSNDL